MRARILRMALMRGSMLPGTVVLLVRCGGSAPAAAPGPVELDVQVVLNSSSVVPGNDWNATVCADDTCKTFSPASCEANSGNDCIIGVGMEIFFKYPTAADLPQHLSLRIVSNAGKLLYSDGKKNDCHLVLANCQTRFIIP